MTLPPCAQDRDALQAALADFERHGADCDYRLVRRAVLDVLLATTYRLSSAFPTTAAADEFKQMMSCVMDDTTCAFEQAIEDAENPDTLAATEADHRRDMNR